MSKIIIYGIPNCDITKKALDWMKDHNIDFVFHDYKKSGITAAKLESWCKQESLDLLLNKKSTTWRSLTAKEQAATASHSAAIKIMIENNSIIKRPVIENGTKLIVGFNAENYSKQLK